MIQSKAPCIDDIWILSCTHIFRLTHQTMNKMKKKIEENKKAIKKTTLKFEQDNKCACSMPYHAMPSHICTGIHTRCYYKHSKKLHCAKNWFFIVFSFFFRCVDWQYGMQLGMQSIESSNNRIRKYKRLSIIRLRFKPINRQAHNYLAPYDVCI